MPKAKLGKTNKCNDVKCILFDACCVPVDLVKSVFSHAPCLYISCDDKI